MGRWITLWVCGVALQGCSNGADEPANMGGGAGGAGPGECSCDAAQAPLSIECLCMLLGCPSLDESAVVGDCATPTYGNTLSTGCGEIRVNSRNRGGISTWVFDAETQELVAANRVDDTPFGPCRLDPYVTTNFEPACSEATTCSLCSGEADVCELP